MFLCDLKIQHGQHYNNKPFLAALFFKYGKEIISGTLQPNSTFIDLDEHSNNALCYLCNFYLGALTQVGVVQVVTEFACPVEILFVIGLIRKLRNRGIIIFIYSIDIIVGFKWASNTEDEMCSHIALTRFLLLFTELCKHCFKKDPVHIPITQLLLTGIIMWICYDMGFLKILVFWNSLMYDNICHNILFWICMTSKLVIQISMVAKINTAGTRCNRLALMYSRLSIQTEYKSRSFSICYGLLFLLHWHLWKEYAIIHRAG